MTAPVDPRPYAGPADLVTAHEAVCEMIRMADVEGAFTRSEGKAIRRACCDMLARLDRERRQACRRGCFAMLHEARVFRTVERSWGYTARTTDNVNAVFLAGTYRAKRRDYLTRALAFRAAASEVAGHLPSPDRAAARQP